jgi:AbrB family looped-hinge helix DNA binding protein
MPTVSVSAAYQVTLPSETVEQLQLRPGQKLSVTVQDGAVLLVPLPDLDDIQGSVKGLSVQGLREKTDRV